MQHQRQNKSYIKKPMNSFFYYRRDMKAKIEKEYQTTKSHDVSRICSQLWAKESPETKAYYQNVSMTAHEDHKAKFPDFDWNPHKNVKTKKLPKRVKGEFIDVSPQILKRRGSHPPVDTHTHTLARTHSETFEKFDKWHDESPSLLVSQDILEHTKLPSVQQQFTPPAEPLPTVCYPQEKEPFSYNPFADPVFVNYNPVHSQKEMFRNMPIVNSPIISPYSPFEVAATPWINNEMESTRTISSPSDSYYSGQDQ
ncbi:hypothetical protein HDV06_006636 [Boothiomyces sp. JEL0866]|nr:hypothetical protein HDV06_006636 [Boothiomyces sp. JEL0866]